MKKTLLATTMLAGLTLGGTVSAEVMTNGNVEGKNKHLNYTISGYIIENITSWDQEEDQEFSGVEDRKFEFDLYSAELNFNIEGVSDAGLTYGGDIELRLSDPINSAGNLAVKVDELNLYFSGDWGRIRLGDQDAMCDIMKLDGNDKVNAVDSGAPLKNINLGQAGANGDLIGLLAAGRTGTQLIADWVHPTLDATKISYETPRFNGFLLGASFTPDTGANLGDVSNDAGTDFEYVWDVALEYKEDFDGVGVRFVASYQHGQNETDLREDLNIVNVGASVEFSGFTIAASYANFFDSGLLKTDEELGADEGFTVQGGLSYKTGPWDLSLGAGYFARDYGRTNDDVNPSLLTVGGGIGYTVAPGLHVRADFTWFDAEYPTTTIAVAGDEAKNDGYAVVLGTQLKF